jgi:thiazole synthase
MSTIATTQTETFEIAGRLFTSRLIIGTGKYRSFAEDESAHRASGAEMVTVAVRRVPLDRSTESFLDHLDPALAILPNTAGCYTAAEAIRTARLAREALNTDLIKLEVIGDQTTLFPDNEQTLEAARVLAREGFTVLPYFSDDLIMAKKLLDAGCAAVMPLAAPIGSGLGVQNPANLAIMREQLPDATIIVDAGVGHGQRRGDCNGTRRRRHSDEHRYCRSRKCRADGTRDASRHSGRTTGLSRGSDAEASLRQRVKPARGRRQVERIL